MKKYLFILCVVLIPAKAFSQISQGSIIIGGDFSLTISNTKTEEGNNTDEGPTFTSFSIVPNTEFFLADNFSAGLGLGYSLNKSKNETANSESIQSEGLFLFTPYVKKYFSLGDRAYFYGQGILGIGFGQAKNEFRAGNVTTSTKENSNSLSIGVVPGFRFDISDKIGLEAAVGFIGFSREVDKSGTGDNEERDITNNFQFRFVPNSLSLGIRYTLN